MAEKNDRTAPGGPGEKNPVGDEAGRRKAAGNGKPVKKRVIPTDPASKPAEPPVPAAPTTPQVLPAEEETVFLVPGESFDMSEESKQRIIKEKLEQMGVLGERKESPKPATLWQRLQGLGLVAPEGGTGSASVTQEKKERMGMSESKDKKFWYQIGAGLAIVVVAFMFLRAISHKPAEPKAAAHTAPAAQQPAAVQPAATTAPSKEGSGWSNLFGMGGKEGNKAQPEGGADQAAPADANQAAMGQGPAFDANTPEWAKSRMQHMNQLREQYRAEMDALRQEQLKRIQGQRQADMPDWMRKHMERIEQLREEMRKEMDAMRQSFREHNAQPQQAAPVPPQGFAPQGPWGGGYPMHPQQQMPPQMQQMQQMQQMPQ